MNQGSGGQQSIHFIIAILPWLGVLVASLILIAIVIGTILRIVNYFRLIKLKTVLLEVTPPAFKNKAPIATEQLFSVIHGMQANRSLVHKLLRQNTPVALEIVSTRKLGIRYLLRIDQQDEVLIGQTISAYIPDAKVKKVDDYITSENLEGSVQVFRQAGHFAYPIDTSKSSPFSP